MAMMILWIGFLLIPGSYGFPLGDGGWPLILVPGDGGSQLEAKLNVTSVPHYICYKKTTDYFNIWLNIEELMTPLVVDCWVQRMTMKYDNKTRTTSNADGVDIQVPGFGGTESVAYLDPTQWYRTQYFHAIIEMATALGYVKGKNIRGAPYDFRRAPNELQKFYENMTKLIEDSYYENGNKKVIIVAHSMGNPVMLKFYHSQSQKWKDKFLRAHVSIAAPWGGSVKILKLFASGYNLGYYRIVVNPMTIRPFQRSMASSAYLMPSESFWAKDEPLVITARRNYTVADYKQFFDDIQYSNGWTMYQDTRSLFGDYKPPGVEVHCLCGTQLDTPSTFIYPKGAFPDVQPAELHGDGDGTVNIRSLRGCLRWNGTQKQAVYYKEFPKTEHLEILWDKNILIYLKTLLTSASRDWSYNVRKMVGGY